MSTTGAITLTMAVEQFGRKEFADFIIGTVRDIEAPNPLEGLCNFIPQHMNEKIDNLLTDVIVMLLNAERENKKLKEEYNKKEMDFEKVIENLENGYLEKIKNYQQKLEMLSHVHSKLQEEVRTDSLNMAKATAQAEILDNVLSRILAVPTLRENIQRQVMEEGILKETRTSSTS